MIINSQLGGKKPSGTKQITANGTHDVAGYASADVQVPTTAPAHYIEKTVDANGMLQNSTNIINLNGVTNVDSYALCGQYAYIPFAANTIINLSSLTAISGQYACQNMFYGCTTGLTGVNLSSLTTISGGNCCNNMFALCYEMANIDLSSLTTLSGISCCQNMFSNCAGITSVNLSSLTTISGNYCCSSMFSSCSNLTSVNFNGLNVISSQIAASYAPVFGSCSKLESITFGGLTASTFASIKNQIAYLFNSTTGSTAPNGCTVHFPSNFDPSDPNHTFDASTLTGYPTFGGNASYIHVAFDLPASE